MSRIGKLPVTIPTGITVKLSADTITLSNTKGTLSFPIYAGVSISQVDNTLVVAIADEGDKQQKAFWGLTRAVVANMVTGLTDGFKKTLQIEGVGYKMEVVGKDKLVLSVGFSHKVDLTAPEGITIAADASEKNMIHISGVDKQQVGYFASLVRSIKKPEPYKGKGIRYKGEHIRRKAGKTAGKK